MDGVSSCSWPLNRAKCGEGLGIQGQQSTAGSSLPTFDLVLYIHRTGKFFKVVTIMIKVRKFQISSFTLGFKEAFTLGPD